jgi:hypothetical protein
MKRLNCTVNDKRGVNGDCMEFHERGVYLRYSEASRRIEALVSKYDKQEAKSTKQLELIAKLEERCTPSKVIMIDDTGHYVSEAVHARMTELEADNKRLKAKVFKSFNKKKPKEGE